MLKNHKDGLDKSMYHGLSDRKMQILKAIVDLYIEKGEPVGSKYLQDNEFSHFSSATIRNEMAELEEMGFLCKAHTSAGRIPTELGYRLYVDNLMQSYSMNAGEIRALRDMLSDKVSELDKILDRAGRYMSAVTNYTALAVKPKRESAAVFRFNLVPIDGSNFLLVAILAAGAVKTKYVRCPGRIEEATLAKLEKVLNGYMAGVDIERMTLNSVMQMEQDMGEDAYLVTLVIKHIFAIMSESGTGTLKFEGVDRLLEYPEFTDVGKLKGMLGLMENKEDIVDLVSDAGDGVKVYIGKENSVSEMNNSTLIFRTIKSGESVIGAIGVIGPCRMDYSKVITTVDTLCREIERTLNGASLPPGKNED